MRDGVSGSADVLRATFSDYEREVNIHNYRVACVLGIIFMPAGVSLDYFVYPEKTWFFLQLRLLCSLLLFGVWAVLGTAWGIKRYRWLGLVEVALPLFFISWMIYAIDGAESPYYAGLNLVLMGSGLVLRWSLTDSIWVFFMAMGMYLTACFLHGSLALSGIFFNNIYFLVVTGVFIITGNYFYNRLRFREFALRFELDQSRQMLEESNRKLLEMDQIKSRFFANISHELRTPLTLLLSPLEMLLNPSRPISREESVDFLGTMHANGMRLLKLINDLLDLVRLESGRIDVKPEPIEVREFVRGVIQSVRKVADDKRISLLGTVEEGLGFLMADRDKLEKILLNLVFNAIKFTPAGGRVEIQARREGSSLWVLRVKDTGMGMSSEQLPFIFDRFWQADSSSHRRYQGAGIGLALVRELAQAQDGDVTVESEVGRGTTMTLSLPFVEVNEGERENWARERSVAAASLVREDLVEEAWLANLYRRAELFPSMTPLEETIRPVETGSAGGRPVILIADDEPDMLRFLKSQLMVEFHVLEAVDGAQAIEKAAQFLPDIVLLDMMMPEKDGLEVCRELRRRTPTQSIPIVLLTARADEETKLAALKAGASDFLTKPFSSTELHVRISNLAAGHRWQRRLAQQNKILQATLEQLKDTEIQLVQSEKMASLGRLSAGIIHEINNPINFAKTGLFTLRKKGLLLDGREREDFQEIVTDVEEGLERVTNIVSDLRTFSHPQSDRFDAIEISRAIQAALRFLTNQWTHKVEVHENLPPDMTVWGNSNQIVQVLVNLLQNSFDALAKKSFTHEEAPAIWISGEIKEKTSAVRLRDNGMGIAPELMPKIFDPFFTTKDVGQGMGLGLSLCYRIMNGHGGRITVASEPGRYCEFTLEFLNRLETK